MGRKWGPCAEPGCPTLTGETRCPEHKSPPWSGSTRRARLPADWPKRVAFVLQRDGNVCYRCGAFGNRVDHVVPGDDHAYDNLACICLDCDKHKSAIEGGRNSWRYRNV